MEEATRRSQKSLRREFIFLWCWAGEVGRVSIQQEEKGEVREDAGGTLNLEAMSTEMWLVAAAAVSRESMCGGKGKKVKKLRYERRGGAWRAAWEEKSKNPLCEGTAGGKGNNLRLADRAGRNEA
ncbi:hypothetical protein CCUS01_01669 [Colletotrichum cuscutae]|uniref:Uncharacterized protein n=1 Tax=Colletotrichum cuscutae TaxID=1209917 RepID=A0AAI9UJN6_9PEZI|nr:hypothetical protein CCUS01_01669 [Colletotrichum cuscutae]